MTATSLRTNHHERPAPVAAPQPGADFAVSVRGLTKRFGRRLAVDHADFDVPKGVVAGFVGPNGAGKTTTLRMLLGLVRPTEGEARVLGERASDPSSYLSRVGALIEGPAFYGGLSGRRNLEVLATLRHVKPGRIGEVLDIVGLGDRADDLYRAYSLGMKQRLGIAAALLAEPDLLLLDEPTNGLDPSGIHDMRILIRLIADAGPTVFLSSHLLTEVESVCQWLVMVDRGRLLYQGPTSALLADTAESIVIATRTPRETSTAARLLRAQGRLVHLDDQRLRIEAPASEAGAISQALFENGIVLTELVPVRTSLEERFLQLTGERQ